MSPVQFRCEMCNSENVSVVTEMDYRTITCKECGHVEWIDRWDEFDDLDPPEPE